MVTAEKTLVSLREVAVDASSYVDPNGFVFRHDGNLYRAIYTQAASFYRGLIDDGTVDELTAHHHLVPTAVAHLAFRDPKIGLVVRHETVWPVTYCGEWCPSMLRDAGAALLDLALAVLDHNCILQDCYPWNVLMRGTEPVVVDLTSIVRIDTPLIWPAYEQFQAFFLRPLALAAMGKGDVARALSSNHVSGISLEAFHHNVDIRYRLRHPSLTLGYHADRIVQRNHSLKRKLQQSVTASKTPVDRRVRERFLKRQSRKLSQGHLRRRNPDVWSNYYRQIDPHVDQKAKVDAVRRVIERVRPETVLDVGCNTGVFSVIAAQAGAKVVALDSSETCVEQLCAAARAQALRVTPLVVDVCRPTPAAGWMARQYPGLVERVRSDLVLCLGLMHHLHVTGRQSFRHIAELMDALSSRHLVFEFVAREDDNVALLGRGRPIEYSLSQVSDELAAFFPSVEMLASDRPTRRLLVCEKDHR